ncbi:DUF1540 domain-containing protein [Anaerosacchariphilus polymeriproducens]|uniref:DUF1540 domain-containing protein n=1 Tax=Anaerosacchariphilus polymeriproducens TaxID=1812858 RepID=A0A371B0F2_9FIRM|nr:DUF1540 domain-containing protein [Anaerosacchariphilus polymeriproducens]RDU25276.1 DUF1540 domain-containing protein [Anaerosacchariphilus polymeriproducens]
MTNLECSVRNCLYNEENRCCKGEIKVGGDEANRTEETCCRSFVERARNVYSNVSGQPSERLQVRCTAANCKYNDSWKCSASHIGIAGSNATNWEDTECSSFRLS